MVVTAGRIVEVGPVVEVSVPAGAKVIDGTGKYLMPGLADMHVHLEREERALLLFVANGVTTVRNMSGGPQHLQWRAQIEAGDLLGPTIYSTGPITDGDPPFARGSMIVTSAAAAERELLAQRDAGYDGMKILTNLRPEVYEAILAASEKYDFPVYGHVPTRVGYRRALGMGQRSFEHTLDAVYDLVPEESPLHSGIIEAWEWRRDMKSSLETIWLGPHRAVSNDRIGPLAAEAAASGAWFCPTLLASRRMHIRAQAFETLQREPYNRYVPGDRRAAWETMVASILSEDEAAHRHALAIELRVAEELHRADARMLAGTDTHPGLPFIVPGFSLQEEVRNLVDVGFTPYEALRAATVEPAAMLRKSDDFGMVKPGQRADLILVKANPLESVANAESRVGVMVRGRWVSDERLQTALDALAQAVAVEGTATQPEHRQ
ncbi:MAG TPA: amidohydrolase family protein [Vicinamibacterales bacterium]|nr:amidohydrolase family protein [Vicinamibacterales bacterium]